MAPVDEQPLLHLHIAESKFLHGRYQGPVDIGVREALRFPRFTLFDLPAPADVDDDVLTTQRLAAADEGTLPPEDHEIATAAGRYCTDPVAHPLLPRFGGGARIKGFPQHVPGQDPVPAHKVFSGNDHPGYDQRRHHRDSDGPQSEGRHPPDQADAEQDREQQGNIPAPTAHERIDCPACYHRHVSAVGRGQRSYRITDDLTDYFRGVLDVKLDGRGKIPGGLAIHVLPGIAPYRTSGAMTGRIIGVAGDTFVAVQYW